MTPEQKQFLDKATLAAQKSGHIFPEMAAAEAALESAWGKSGLATLDNNLFGTKQHKHAIYGTHALPTKESENGEWITVEANWIHYPDLPSCFFDRMVTLNRLATAYPHYKAALEATDAESYIREVSQTWSTDPARADKALSIYRQYIAEGQANGIGGQAQV